MWDLFDSNKLSARYGYLLSGRKRKGTLPPQEGSNSYSYNYESRVLYLLSYFISNLSPLKGKTYFRRLKENIHRKNI
jgi:hypothetical protein